MNYLRQFKSWNTWWYSIALAFLIDRGAVFTHWRHGDYALPLNALGLVVGVLGWVLGLLMTALFCAPVIALFRYLYALRRAKRISH
jgi:energy-converting hydrogenase Eha subunit A